MTLLLAGALALMTAAGPTDPPSLDQLTAQTDAWHQKRIERLKAEDGWLTLVGLDWLEEGDNAVGHGGEIAVTLPASVPAHVGTFTRHGKDVSFTPAKGVPVTLDGKPFPGGKVKTDAEAQGPDVLKLGSVQMLPIVRGDRVGVRVRDANSPVRKNFQGIPRYPVSLEWRKVARWEPAPEGRTEKVVNVLGQVEETPIAGTLVFTHHGKTVRLEAMAEDDVLFIVFGDETNGHTTYPAGRFLVADPPKDGTVVVDFNRAYNPPCSFTHFATCPLPTKENRLKLRVEAGEKSTGHGHG
jgi:uncharacterized protein (DUF1684 family)